MSYYINYHINSKLSAKISLVNNKIISKRKNLGVNLFQEIQTIRDISPWDISTQLLLYIGFKSLKSKI